jgi:hypothetical protein
VYLGRLDSVRRLATAAVDESAGAVELCIGRSGGADRICLCI